MGGCGDCAGFGYTQVGGILVNAPTYSTSSCVQHAFIAATLQAFSYYAKLAFLVFGPMMDVKLIFMYSSVFRKRFVFVLAVGLFILVGVICVRWGAVRVLYG